MPNLKRLFAGNKDIVIFLIGMIIVRSAIADWYSVPSGSMYPTLIIGDRIVANRLAYDLKIPFTDVILLHLDDPERGDIVTFISPEDGNRLVKRVIGLPGDVIEMRNEKLVVNGVAATYAAAEGDIATQLTPDYPGRQLVLNERLQARQQTIIVMPERGAVRSFGPVTVPAGEYLMLGDNRDNSRDSRFIGFIKRELLTGRVRHVAFSLDTERYYLPRPARFGAAL